MAKVATALDFQFGSNGTPTSKVDNSTKTKSVDFPREQDLQDVSEFGTTSRKFAVGLSTGTFKAEFYYDSTIYTQLQGLIGYTTAVDFLFGPDGTTSGYPKYTGTMYVKSVGTPVTVGETKMVSVDFQINGTITATTY